MPPTPFWRNRLRSLFTASILLFSTLLGSAAFSAPLSREQEELIKNHLIDKAVPPETIADAIVDFIPRSHMPLNVASREKRKIDGSVIKLERGSNKFLNQNAAQMPSIVHSANTLIAPLKAGMPVKLFLKHNLESNDYYVIAIMPVNYKIGEKQ